MAQVKIYGLKDLIEKNRIGISNAIHESLKKAFMLPADKKFQRFISLAKDEFIFPKDRTENYTIIEISVFEGRSIEAKKELIKEIYKNLEAIGIESIDVEITIFETPKCNWGIRGLPGDELTLNYKVDV